MAPLDYDAVGLAELDPDELRQLLQFSDEFFIEYFLSEEIEPDQQVEDFHLLVFGRFTDLSVRKEVAALPREHAKTTYLRLAILKLIYFSPIQFFVYMSATHAGAASSIESIWNRVISEQGQLAFGLPEIQRERLSEGHIEFWVTAYRPNGNKYQKLIIIKALGVGQTLRGMNIHNMRPEYVACDDIEDEAAIKTPEGYAKLKHWFDNTFMRAVSRKKGRSKIAQIGNLIGLQTLLNDNITDPEWRSMRLGVLRSNGKPLWAAQWSIAEIKADLARAKRRGSLSAWFGEMMNMPYNIENALIPYEKIFFTPQRHPADGNKYKCFITIDPAISAKTSADECAIVLHTIDEIGVPQCSEYVCQIGMDPAVMSEIVLELCLKWNCWVIGCESVQLQVVLIHYFRLAFETQGLFGYDFVPIEIGQTHKTARLRTWASAVQDKEYSIPEDDWGIVQQLINFDVRKTNNKDDLIDSCSMGLYMLKYYSDMIFSNRASLTAEQVDVIQHSGI